MYLLSELSHRAVGKSLSPAHLRFPESSLLPPPPSFEAQKVVLMMLVACFDAQAQCRSLRKKNQSQKTLRPPSKLECFLLPVFFFLSSSNLRLISSIHMRSIVSAARRAVTHSRIDM